MVEKRVMKHYWVFDSYMNITVEKSSVNFLYVIKLIRKLIEK